MWYLTCWPQAAVSMLKQDYKEGEMTLSSALALAVKVLNKTMDVSKLSAEKGEVQSCCFFLFVFINLISFADSDLHLKLESLTQKVNLILK